MTDLTDRMRTCAAAIIAVDPKSGWVALVTEDAANLLIEASNALEAVPAPLGEPMEVIPAKPPIVPDRTLGGNNDEGYSATWYGEGGTLPLPGAMKSSPRSSRACPQCDSHAPKRVRRDDNKLMFECPACGTKWEWKR